MSDDFTHFIPVPTGFQPTPESTAAAIDYLREIFPSATIEERHHASIVLFDCGGNFQAAHCPKCNAKVGNWSDLSEADYDLSATPPGFLLKRYILACCGAEVALDQLIYKWPMAFGRFGLTLNKAVRDEGASSGPSAGLTWTELQALAGRLGCAEVTMIYQHV